MMKTVLKIVGLILLVAILIGAASYAWASRASGLGMSRTLSAHRVDFPVPFPLEEDPLAAPPLPPDQAERLALERAVERGRHPAVVERVGLPPSSPFRRERRGDPVFRIPRRFSGGGDPVREPV